MTLRSLALPALAVVHLTCAAAPVAPASKVAAAPASAAAPPEEAAPMPLPKRPPTPPLDDHPEPRKLEVLLRDVSDGFETLVARTDSFSHCWEAEESGAEVQIEGARDPRRAWSGWFQDPPAGSITGVKPGPGGYLFVRRPLPGADGSQIANVHSLANCLGGLRRDRFVLPEAASSVSDPRATRAWARALGRHVSPWTGWGAFVRMRLLERFAEPAVPEVKAVAAGKDRAKTKGKPAAKAAKPPGKPIATAPAPRVTAPRRNPSELARLMDTTTGMASLQETLQTDRLLQVGAEPATVPLAEVKPPPLAAHPFPAMLAALGKPVPAEPLAAAAPAEFYFVRFASIAHFYRLRDEIEGGLTTAVSAFDERSFDYGLGDRLETELGVKQGPLSRALGPSVIQDLAIVGSDPYLREGSDVTLVFRVKAAPAFEAALTGMLAAHGAAHGGLANTTLERGGAQVQVSRSADGAVRRHRASAGGFEILSNSPGAIGRVLAAIKGRAPRLADEPDFRYMLARDTGVPADVFAFISDRFVAEVVGPRQKILEARRQLALAELSRPGFAALLHAWVFGKPPATADELVASGLLKREELGHAGGERIDWAPGRAARSSWGRVGALTPLIDLPPLDKVTPSENEAYATFVAGYQNYWRTYMDPIAIRIGLSPKPGGRLDFDLRILPIISGTEYSQLMHTVGNARIGAGDGKRGLRTVLGIGPDAEIRRLLSRSIRELPMVGGLKIDWLGDWALVGLDDAWPPKRGPKAEGQPRGRIDQTLAELVELPLYAGIEVKNRGAAAAFLAGARTVVDSAAPGVIDWREAGRQRDVPFVAVRAAAGEAKSEWHDLALYYAFCKTSLLLSLSEASLRRRIDDCVDGRAPRAVAAGKAGAGEAPQWILEADVRERGPAWWLLARAAERSELGATTTNRAAASAEAVLRAAPGATPAAAQAMAREVFGFAPVTPEGRAYFLLMDGVHDPLRGRVHDPLRQRNPYALHDLLGSGASPFVRLLRVISHARSEVAFDDEPAIKDSERPRSLHVRLRLN